MESQRIRLSVVNYLNARPFAEGFKLLHPKIEFELSEDIPSLCAEKLEQRQVDIGLIPVAKIKDIPTSRIITSYCIAADGPVDSVVLVSHKPLEHITEITMDMESRTSVMLAKILAVEFWKIQPKWTSQGPQQDFARADTIESAVMIGDNPATDGAGASALGIPFILVGRHRDALARDIAGLLWDRAA